MNIRNLRKWLYLLAEILGVVQAVRARQANRLALIVTIRERGIKDVNLEQTNEILDRTIQKANEMNLPPLCMAIVDTGGHLLNFRRQDGAPFFFLAQICIGKAWGVAAMRRSTRALGDRFKDRPHFLNSLIHLADGKLVPVPGGVLIAKEGQVLGALGVSGAFSDEDEACAIAGIEAAGFEAII